MEIIDQHYATCFLIAAIWTTVFSMTTKRIRGMRNFGILACYLMALVMIFCIKFKSSAATWCVFGVAGGLMYTSYEIISRLKCKETEKPSVSFTHIFYGIAAWPIMMPEAIEYTLAELHLLPTASLRKKQDDNENEPQKKSDTPTLPK